MRTRQGLLTVPPGTDIVLFLQHDGKPPQSQSGTDATGTGIEILSLACLRKRYLKTHRNGSATCARPRSKP